ncbi:AT-hook motif nuclear-localized protein 28-like isoform X2 [Gastrolobium bilobum]|uniref:AT-hook motif nuclear-localized protein 28-like isoform X2 n=1 Tax=Gastrolobium bilobum TaxID=150636 RepID=UPI002AB00D2D|nr:AT-hook motif nuclear-localized protein 28-like isoform X2 [Gastrolobium bilobum]
MFSKLHQHQQQQQQHQQQQQQHPFQLSRDCQTSEDDDSRSSGGLTPSTAQNLCGGGGGDEATIEVVRRPRGRPPGSKNKPKPSLIITREPEPAMSPYILEVPGGSDVVESIARFSRRNNTGLCVLTGSGTVANVTLRQPSTTPGAIVTFHGRFDILSLSATFLLHNQPGASPAVPNNFSISLAGPQGQIFGGIVAGRLLAAGTVFVTSASFNNPSYHRLPSEEDVQNNSVSGGGDVKSPLVSGGGAESGHVHAESLYQRAHGPAWSFVG